MQITPDSLLTSHQAGSLLQVNPSSINKWVKEGRIPAFRTPGGHRRIRASDLVSFLTEHQMPVPRDLEGASKRRVLLVDDDEAQLRTIARAFEEIPSIELVTCDNAVEALVKVGSFRPHLVILDILMPGMDGFETCERLRQNPETAEISIVMTSGALTDEMRKRAESIGVAAVMPKPLDVHRVASIAGISAQRALAD
ncbi:MAG: response regulator [Myxococcota bacterium]